MSSDHADDDLLLQELTMIAGYNTERMLCDVISTKKPSLLSP